MKKYKVFSLSGILALSAVFSIFLSACYTSVELPLSGVTLDSNEIRLTLPFEEGVLAIRNLTATLLPSVERPEIAVEWSIGDTRIADFLGNPPQKIGPDGVTSTVTLIARSPGETTVTVWVGGRAFHDLARVIVNPRLP